MYVQLTYPFHPCPVTTAFQHTLLFPLARQQQANALYTYIHYGQPSTAWDHGSRGNALHCGKAFIIMASPE